MAMAATFIYGLLVTPFDRALDQGDYDVTRYHPSPGCGAGVVADAC